MTPDNTGRAQYDELDNNIRENLTFEQWVWLSDYEKATLAQRETEPELWPS